MGSQDTQTPAAPDIDHEARSKALARVPVEDRSIRSLELASELFSPAERQQVAALLTVPAESPALMPFLALCVAEGFSPWANHVWLIPKKVKTRAQDGAEVEETKHIPTVGRDGLLHKARQSKGARGGFKGLQAQVVCERDSFDVVYTGDIANDPQVLHRFASKPTEFAADVDPGRYRGKIIGAWAKCYVDGEPPTFYFASVKEHARLKHVWAWNEAVRKRQPMFYAPDGGVTFAEFTQRPGGGMDRNRPVQEFEGAWDYLSTMILKAAQSYVLRIALGVTGFVPHDELRDPQEWAETPLPAVDSTTAGPDGFDLEEALPVVDPELRERLQRAVDTANEQDAFSWGPAKCEMVLTNRSEAELRSIVEDIESENDLRAQRLDRESREAETITDAEIVEEPPAKPPVPSEEEVRAERVEWLRGRVEELRERIGQAGREGVPDAGARAELDQVETELRSLGAGEDS